MSESYQAEMALWQARCDEMQVALERVREHRDDLQQENAKLKERIKVYSSMVERMQIALSEGREL
jgi:predicted nuclease with TOPRIM domain